MKTKIKLYDIYIFLITLFKGVGANADNILYVLAFIIGCVAVFGKICNEKYSKKEFLFMVFIICVGLLDFLIGKTTTILFTAVAICGLKNVDTTHIINLVFLTRITAFSCMILLSTIGIIQNENMLFYRNGEFINRYSFGYGHPNLAHLSLAIIILLFIYIYGEKLKLYHYIIMIGINYIFYQFTYSRTGFYMVFICILLWAAMKNITLQNALMRIFKYMYFVLIVITALLGFLYSRVNILYTLDKLLTGRILYINQLITKFYPPIIGSSHYSQYVNLDNGYMALLYQGGVLAFVWMSYCIIKLCNKMYKERRVKELFLITCFNVYSMTEGILPSIAVNISLVFAGEVIFELKSMHQRKTEGYISKYDEVEKT